MSDNYHDVRIKELDRLLKKEQKENELHSLIARIINAADDLTAESLMDKTTILMKYGFLTTEEYKYLIERFETEYK